MSCCSWEPKASLVSAADLAAVQALIYSPVADLAALALAAGEDGAVRRVISLRDFFVATNRSSPRATEALVVLAHPAGGNWRWERLLILDPSWGDQDQFYVDPVGGDDEYDGSSATFVSGKVGPLKSLTELVQRRLGLTYTVRNKNAQPFTSARVQNIAVLGDCNEEITWHVNSDFNARVNLYGAAPVQSFSGTISAKTDYNSATNTPADVTSTWTPANELQRLVHTQIGGALYAAWVLKDLTGGKARVNAWTQVTGPNGNGLGQGTTVVINPAVVSAALTTHTLPGRVKGLILTTDLSGGSSPLYVYDLDIYGRLQTTALGTQLHIVRCKISGTPQRFGHGSTYLSNCLITGTSTNAVGNDAPSILILNSGACLGTFSTIPRYNELVLRYGFVMQGNQLSVTNGLLRIDTSGAIFCDQTGDAVRLLVDSRLRQSSALGGTGIGGYGIRAEDGCSLIVDSGITPGITGASGDFCFGPSASTKTTARAYDDTAGAEIGTARTLSWANLAATVAGGGFGGAILERTTLCRAILAS